MNGMSSSDIHKFGGLILAGLKAEEIQVIADPNLRLEIIRKIGQIAFEKLMPITDIENIKSFAAIGIEGRTSLTKEDLDDLGSLVFFIPPQSWKLASSEVIKAFLESNQRIRFLKHICLPWDLATPLMNILIKVFG